MPGGAGLVGHPWATFGESTSAKARRALPVQDWKTGCFFVPGGDIFDDRLVTFLMAARPLFIRKW